MSLPDQLVRTRRFSLGVPDRFTVTADGTTVLFLRTRAGDDPVTCLWALDPDTGRERLVATDVDAYTVADTGPLGYTSRGELWAGDPPRRLPTATPVTDPRFDPAGKRIAYVHDGAVRVIGVDGTDDHAVAEPDAPDVTFGVAEVTPRAHWWAPDGTRLLVLRVDESRVELWHVADPAHPDQPPRTVRYPAVGTANPDVSLWLVGLDGDRAEARWDHNAFEYLVHAGWDAHGPFAVVQSRHQRTVRFLAVDPATGDTSVVTEQRDACWVQLVPGAPARTASGALVAHVDRDGTRHLTVDGVAVTPPGRQLREVLDVDGEDVLFTASDDPTETHLWSYHPRTGLRRWSDEPAVHTAVRRGDTVVRVARAATRQVSVLRKGKPPVPVVSHVERPVLDIHATPLVLGPRALRGRLHLPSWHTGERLPVLLDPYGGAGSQRVTAEHDSRVVVSQWFAEQGFAVLVVDGSGTPGRGPDWEREVHGDVFGPVLDDQVAALHEAARLRPELDLDRVGIRGWSFSGSLALFAVLTRPDVFDVAVAGAGVTDQHLYNAHWRERFLGHPADHPERYTADSLIRLAPNLTRPLLLIHGLADTNVFPVNTFRLSSALQAAGRPHEVLLLPGIGHQAVGEPGLAHLLDHQARFLRRYLVDTCS